MSLRGVWGRRASGWVALLVLSAAVTACDRSPSLEQVHALQRAGHWEESAAALRRLVEEQPDDVLLVLEYGKALLGSSQPTRAIWPLRRAAQSEAHGVEAGLLLAQALLATANGEDAIRAATAVLEVEPEHAAALFVRSRAFVAAKRHEDGLIDADLYVELEPDDPQGRLLQLGILLMMEDAEQTAVALAEAAPVFDPNGPLGDEAKARFCMLEATFAWERGDRGEGLEKAEACIERYPEQSLVVDSAVALFDRAEQSDRATAVLVAALERDPAAPKIRLTLVHRMEALGEDDEAERLLREGTSVLPGGGPWLALHDHHVRREDYDQARRAIERALALEPDPPAAVLIAYADDLILSGDLDAAEQVTDDLVPPGSHFVRGRILLARGDAAGALREIEAGLPLWPDNPTARWLAGQAAERLGNFPAAISHYRESVRADAANAAPARSPAALELSRIYAAMGAGHDALDFGRRHLEANPRDLSAALWLLELAHRFGADPARAAGLEALASIPGARAHLVAQRAQVRADRNGPDAGIAFVEEARAEGSPDAVEVLRVLASLEIEAGRPLRARARVASQAEPATASLPFLLLFMDVLEELKASATERSVALHRAAALDPSHPRVLLARARLARERGELAHAVELFDAIPADVREFVEGRLESAALLRAESPMSEDAAVVERLEQALSQAPRDPRPMLERARVFAAMDPASDAALELARRATLMGGGAEAASFLGRLWLERGEVAIAEQSLVRVTTAFPHDARSHYWLGRAREAAGDFAGAGDAYARALGLDGLLESERAHAASAQARLQRSPDA